MITEAVPAQLSGTFADLPGIAPVPIDDGTMHVTATGTVGGEEVVFEATSSVNVGPKADVAMPRLMGSVVMDPDRAGVELSTFGFVFDKMMGINIAAECVASKGGDLGPMSLGSNSTKKQTDRKRADRSDAADAEQAVGTQSTSASGDGNRALLMWAVPVGVAVAGPLFWLSRRLLRNV